MTAKTIKAPNYTTEQTAQLLADYSAGLSIETIATALGRTVRSIVAKLVREGVYKSAKTTVKPQVTPATKDTIADAIGEFVSLTEAETTSLTGANKTALFKIASALKATSEAAKAIAEAEDNEDGKVLAGAEFNQGDSE